MRRTNCPACDCGNTVRRYEIGDYEIFRCRRCFSLFVGNVPSDADLSAIYADKTYYSMGQEAVERIKLENARRVNELTRLGARGSLLDVGCAAGLFLDAAREGGFVTSGVEQSAHTAAKARANGHTVYLGSLEQLGDQLGQHDVVVSLDVIEHVVLPFEFLRLLATCVKPGGLLVVSTPNYSGLLAKVLGKRDPFLIPPEHLNFFSARGLKALGEKAGLSIWQTRAFGQVLDDEIERGFQKFVPRAGQFLRPVLAPGINSLFAVLNKLKLGLELEFYFRKPA